MEEGLLRSFLEEVGASKIARSNSNNLQCTCPFAEHRHGTGKDSNPSFSISLDTVSKWNCFACGSKGLNFKSLVRALGSLGGRDLSSWENAEKSGEEGKKEYSLAIKGPKKWAFDAAEEEKFFEWKDYEHMTKRVHEYALKRGLTKDQLEKWRIGYNQEEHRIFIPCFDVDGVFVGYSGRAIPPHEKTVAKYKHVNGWLKKLYLYGEEYLDTTYRTCILVEGFMDVWALDRAGYNNVFAYMGTSLSEWQLFKLYKWFDTVIIIPDNDPINPTSGKSPGRDASIRCQKAINNVGKRAILSPVIKNKKDVADWTVQEIHYVLLKISVEHNIQLPHNIAGDANESDSSQLSSCKRNEESS
jgi:DNA primase